MKPYSLDSGFQILFEDGERLFCRGWRVGGDGDRSAVLVVLPAAALILIAVTCYRSDFHTPGYYALLPTVGAACLLFSGQGHTTIISKALSWLPVVYIGSGW